MCFFLYYHLEVRYGLGGGLNWLLYGSSVPYSLFCKPEIRNNGNISLDDYNLVSGISSPGATHEGGKCCSFICRLLSPNHCIRVCK